MCGKVEVALPCRNKGKCGTLPRGGMIHGPMAANLFESKFEPLQVIWQLESLRRLFQKVIEGLEGKINGQALGAALWLSLRGSDGRAQAQSVSESVAVAAGSDQLA